MPPFFAAGFVGIEHFAPPWDVFFLPLFNLLVFFYNLLFNDFALAIIVFTVLIRTVLAPLFIRQIRSQKEMQRMQPLIKEVQRKHKGNRAKISEETMALYKEHGVNPAAGCLPVVLQLPILWALYQALIRASNVVTLTAEQVKSTEFAQLQQALPGITKISDTQFTAPINGACNLDAFNGGPFTHFLPLNCQLVDPVKLGDPINTVVGWLFNPFTGVHLDLARVDHAFSIVLGNPETGFAISLLAIVAAALQFVQVKMTTPSRNPDDPTSAATSTMSYLFPLMTIFWGGIFPSGLILYWIIYTAYLVVQQFLIMGWGNLFPILGWQPPFAASPEPALVSGPSRRRELAPAADEADSPPSITRSTGARQSQGRPAKPRSGQKRRGRKR
ncbi:MAG TPA: YidC/Oxa1 family membrane protein insertase [Candidatus Limnocylindria bacterium]|nr:YidC/Oxa1 family membrane protein insertase [Candidatus Limnocylindria bacterium]